MEQQEFTFTKLMQLHHIMRAAHHQHAQSSGPMADVSRGRGRVLALLKLHDGVSTRDIANVLDIRVSSLNETLSRLEAHGFIERKQSTEDGRIMLVYLTDKGRATNQPTQDVSARLFNGFTNEELEELDGYLDRMIAAMEEELGPDWREQEQRRQHRRKQVFFQADEHRAHKSPHGGHEHHRHGGRDDHGGHEERGRKATESMRGDCDHNCRQCTREVCVHGKRRA